MLTLLRAIKTIPKTVRIGNTVFRSCTNKFKLLLIVN